jgi:hypothetical protein
MTGLSEEDWKKSLNLPAKDTRTRTEGEKDAVSALSAPLHCKEPAEPLRKLAFGRVSSDRLKDPPLTPHTYRCDCHQGQ